MLTGERIVKIPNGKDMVLAQKVSDAIDRSPARMVHRDPTEIRDLFRRGRAIVIVGSDGQGDEQLLAHTAITHIYKGQRRGLFRKRIGELGALIVNPDLPEELRRNGLGVQAVRELLLHESKRRFWFRKLDQIIALAGNDASNGFFSGKLGATQIALNVIPREAWNEGLDPGEIPQQVYTAYDLTPIQRRLTELAK